MGGPCFRARDREGGGFAIRLEQGDGLRGHVHHGHDAGRGMHRHEIVDGLDGLGVAADGLHVHGLVQIGADLADQVVAGVGDQQVFTLEVVHGQGRGLAETGLPGPPAIHGAGLTPGAGKDGRLREGARPGQARFQVPEHHDHVAVRLGVEHVALAVHGDAAGRGRGQGPDLLAIRGEQFDRAVAPVGHEHMAGGGMHGHGRGILELAVPHQAFHGRSDPALLELLDGVAPRLEDQPVLDRFAPGRGEPSVEQLARFGQQIPVRLARSLKAAHARHLFHGAAGGVHPADGVLLALGEIQPGRLPGQARDLAPGGRARRGRLHVGRAHVVHIARQHGNAWHDQFDLPGVGDVLVQVRVLDEGREAEDGPALQKPGQGQGPVAGTKIGPFAP